MKNSLINILAAVHTTTTRARRLAIAVAALAGTLGGLAPTVRAEIVSTHNFRISGGLMNGADFGSGSHYATHPTGNASLTWDFSAGANNSVNVKARVRGTLYIDQTIPANWKARLRVKFCDYYMNVLSSHTIEFCGPGWDANSPDNQRWVDISSSNPLVQMVKLEIGAGLCGGSIVEQGFSFNAPYSVVRRDTINNGSTDFGSGSHLAGTPTDRAEMWFVLYPNGQLKASVTGILYWDSILAGSARLIIDFLDANGAVLSTRTITESANAGGNALSTSNQTGVYETLTDASVRKIRLKVGQWENGKLKNTVTRTYSLAS